MDDGSKQAKVRKRVKKQQQIIEAEKYHHAPGRKSLEATKAKGGYAEDQGEGINEDLHSKVGQKLQSLRAGLHTSRERARRRGRAVFASR